MKIKKEILYFIIALTSLTVWDILYKYKLLAGNIWSALFFASICIWLNFTYKLINDFLIENNYFKIIFFLLFTYNLVIIARGLPHNYNDTKTIMQSGFIFWAFIIPIFVFFEKKTDTLVQLFKIMYYLGVVFLIIAISYPNLIISRSTAETFIHPLAFGSGFLLMNTKYLSKKKSLISFLVCTLSLLSFVYLARRNAIITFSGFLVASIFLNIKNMSFGNFIKIFPIIAGIIILAITSIDKIPSSFSGRLLERGTEDTRSGIFEYFKIGMQDDWIFGKGMNGIYYCPFGDTVLDDGTVFSASEYRALIETGYLQLILNGGITEVVLFIMLLLPAAYLGIFKSSNSLSRSCGIIILLWLIDMFIYGLPTLTLHYIFVWICVGICYKKSFREIPDDEIYETFQKIGLS